MKTDHIIALKKVLANLYTIYLKTQNYHWHVQSQNFYSVHMLLESQYTALTTEIDDVAERIITLGEQAPATYREFAELTAIKEGDSSLPMLEMLKDLCESQSEVIASLKTALKAAAEHDDVGSEDILSSLVSAHEKMLWMLKSTLNG